MIYIGSVFCIFGKFSTYGTSFASECNCLPQCSDTFYDVEPESIQIDDVAYESEMTRGVDIDNASFVYIYFRDVSYIEYRKQNIISWDSLLASFGGIFGLCLGGSVISLVELLYYLAQWFFYLLKGSTSSRRNFPAASQVFLSVPVRASNCRKFNAVRGTNVNDGRESSVYILSDRILVRPREEFDNDGNRFRRRRNSTIQLYYD